MGCRIVLAYSCGVVIYTPCEILQMRQQIVFVSRMHSPVLKSMQNLLLLLILLQNSQFGAIWAFWWFYPQVYIKIRSGKSIKHFKNWQSNTFLSKNAEFGSRICKFYCRIHKNLLQNLPAPPGSSLGCFPNKGRAFTGILMFYWISFTVPKEGNYKIMLWTWPDFQCKECPLKWQVADGAQL